MEEQDCSPKIIQLAITKNYAPHWRTWEGIREMVQNWHDGLYLNGTDYEQPVFTKKGIKINEVDKMDYYSVHIGQSQTEIGQLCHDQAENALTLINKNTSLQRCCLLMGHTDKGKGKNDKIIGQFGEGMKVGALALLRENRNVCVRTSADVWKFGLKQHEMLMEEVLTVFLKPRNDDKITDFDFGDIPPPCTHFKLEEGDTCTQVWPVSKEEWSHFAKRFIFLEDVRESVSTEIGTLLLDDHLSGDLYTKMVWIRNMTEDGLITGLNLKELKLDRDRNTVIKKNDVEHRASCIWCKALRRKEGLAEKYLELLEVNESCDVKHAHKYADEEAANILYDAFHNKYKGTATVFPVHKDTPQEHVHVLQQDPNKKVVCCNQNLFDIFKKTGKLPSLEEVIDEMQQQREKYIGVDELNSDERAIFGDMLRMVQMVEKQFPHGIISIVDSNERKDVAFSDTKVDVPRWMLSTDGMHRSQKLKCQFSECKCAATYLSTMILNYWQGGSTNTIARHTLLTSALASAACSRVKREDQEVTKKNEGKKLLSENERKLVESRAKQLEGIKRDLERRFEDAEKSNKVEMEKLNSQLREVQAAYEEDKQKFKTDKGDIEKKLRTEQESNRSKYERIVKNKEIELKKSDEQIKEMEEQLKELESDKKRLKSLLKDPDGSRLQLQVNEKKTKHYVNRLKEIVTELDTIRDAKDGVVENSELHNCLNKLSDEIEKSTDKELCLLCNQPQTGNKYILLPCGHQVYCETCVHMLQEDQKTCRICKMKFTDVQKMF